MTDFNVPVWAHMLFVCSEASPVPWDRRRRPHGAAVTAIQPAECALLFREGLMGKNLLHFKSSVTQKSWQDSCGSLPWEIWGGFNESAK